MNWLWDKRLTLHEAKKILKASQHKRFLSLASTLFMRNNDPQIVFKQYVDPLVFCHQWTQIKKQMQKDEWNSPRILFWQTIYEKLLIRYKKQGVLFRKKGKPVYDPLCMEVGNKIRAVRKEIGLSQDKLAKKIGVSQQLLSRIENGADNISLITLKNISKGLNKKIKLDLV